MNDEIEVFVVLRGGHVADVFTDLHESNRRYELMEGAEPSAARKAWSRHTIKLPASAAPVFESLPEGVTPNPQTYTLAAGAASPAEGEGWEYDFGGAWLPCGGGKSPSPRTIRRAAPPQPDTEQVPWGVALLDRRMVIHPDQPPFRATVASYLSDALYVWNECCGVGVPVSPDGMVTVLRDSGTDTDRSQR